ncbi:MAG: NMP kinase [Candidatus Aenigmatarchaeota archaeon]|nr:MAG: NMP kinase [Candidatus Aenigmarchaeota archaeon]
MWIAITGTPGTGKSRVAEELGKKLGWKVLHLGDLADRFRTGWDKKRACWIVDHEKMGKELKKMHKNENLILEGHFSHLLPVDIIFVLRLNPSVLRKRLERREWPEEKIQENLEAEIMQVCLDEARETGKPVFEIDANKKLAEIVNKIVECLGL